MSDTSLVKKAEKYVDTQMEITEEEANNLDAANVWLARLNSGNRNLKGSWNPRLIDRPGVIRVSRRQLRGIGINYGK